nr:PadR family transcriptional regulator [Pseudaestuariivita rosea]
MLEKEMHGYEVGQEYERQEVQDWASVSKAQVYYALKKLAENGLIEPAKKKNQPDARGKTVYRVTEDGRGALQETLSKPSWAQSRIPQPFSTWVGLSIDTDAETRARMFKARKDYLIKELEKEEQSLIYVQTLNSPRAAVGAKTIALTISLMKAELAWICEVSREPAIER